MTESDAIALAKTHAAAWSVPWLRVHTEFENRHLVPKPLAREALREFFKSGRLSPVVEWEQYFA